MGNRRKNNLITLGLAIASMSSLSSASNLSEKLIKPPAVERHVSFNIEDEMAIMREMRIKEMRAKEDAKKAYESKIEALSKVDYKTQNFKNDPDYVLLGRLIFGEASGCSDYEKIAVAWTAINRAHDGIKWNGETLRGAILAPRQYSTFNSNANTRIKNPMKYDSKNFLEDLVLAQEILDGKYSDPTHGATHYFNRNTPDLKGKAPYWAASLDKVTLDKHTIHEFYKKSART